MNNNSKSPWWVSGADIYSSIAVSLGFVSAFIIVGYQCFNWLQDGYWISLPLIKLFSSNDFFTNYNSWYNSPDSWVGVNKIVTWIFEKLPISIACIGLGFLIKFFWFVSVEDYKQKHPLEAKKD